MLLIKSIKLYDYSSKLEFNADEFNFENSSSIKDIKDFKKNLKYLINNINNNDTNYIYELKIKKKYLLCYYLPILKISITKNYLINSKNNFKLIKNNND